MIPAMIPNPRNTFDFIYKVNISIVLIYVTPRSVPDNLRLRMLKKQADDFRACITCGTDDPGFNHVISPSALQHVALQ